MNKAYRRRIAVSKARLDAEMQSFADSLHHLDRKGRVACLVEKFPAIDRDYAEELAR